MVERLFNRLLRKAGLSADTPPSSVAEWQLIQRLMMTALGEIKERQFIAENSLAMNSTEMEHLYEELKVKTETQLEDQSIFLTTVLESLPVGVYCKLIADDFRYVLWNRTAATIFGIATADALGKTDADLFDSERAEHIRRLDLDCCNRATVVSTPEEILTQPARNFVIRTHRVIVRDRDDKPRFLLGVAEDITAEREARQSVVHSAKMASLGEMAGGIAHEINNPLAIIHGKAMIINRLLGRTPVDIPQVQKLAITVVETCDRIESIIKGLRSSSRLADNDPLRQEAVDEIIANAVNLCAERFKSNGVKLTIELPEQPILINCRQVQIGQVLLNLLGNAFDAIKDLTDKWVTISARLHGEAVRLAVTDSGLGIPEAVRTRMMQPFFTTKEVGKGTGLGLSISATIVHEHGGTLTYEASSGHTTFLITLPRA